MGLSRLPGSLSRCRWYCTYWWENWASSILILEWQGIHVYHLQQRRDLFKHNIPKLTDLDGFQWAKDSQIDWPKTSQWAARTRCRTRKGEPAVRCGNKVCGSSVLNSKRAGGRAVISILKSPWTRVIRVRHSTVTTEQICSSKAGPRPSQEAKPARPGQTHRGGRLGRVTVATQFCCGMGRGSTEVSAKRSSQEKNMAALTSRSICNSS